MKILNISLAIVLTTLLLAVAAYLSISNHPETAHASVADSTFIGAATTTAATSITTSARIMATTTNPISGGYTRAYAVICNPNANPVFINMDNDIGANLVTGNVTTVIAAAAGYNACFEITGRNLYQGSVTASSTNQTATTITVKQYVQ